MDEGNQPCYTPSCPFTWFVGFEISGSETRTFWEQAINFAPSWFERVPTKCNPADAPSRGTTPELPAGYSLKEV